MSRDRPPGGRLRDRRTAADNHGDVPRSFPSSLPVRALFVGLASLLLGVAAVWGGDLLLAAAAGTTLLALVAAAAERRRDVAALAASERRLSQAHSIARMGTWQWVADGDRLEWSDELCRICGFQAGHGPADMGAYVAMLDPEDRLAMQAEHAGLRDGATGFAFLHRLTCPDGVQRTLRGRAEVVRDADGRPARLAGTAQDVSGEWDGLERLQAAEEQFRRVFEDAPIGMVISDLDGRVLRVNAALCALVGHPRERLEGVARDVLMPAEDGHAAEVGRARLVGGELPVLELETRLLHADGTPIEILASATLARDEHGEPLHVVTQVLDVTERKRFEGQLQYLSDHDPLTGLFNRRRFEHELQRELAAATRYGSGGAVLVLDLDHFKYVNDALGHSVGDRLIARVAEAVRARLRRSDVLARLGGDEFAVVLAQVDEEQARLVAESLLDTVRAEGEVGDHDRRRRVSASIGIAMFAHAGDLSAEEVLVEADIAMYDAKEAGRDCVVVFDAKESRQLRMQARLSWAERIRRALDEDRFVLHAQPIVGLGSDSENRYEVLLRMVGDDGDLIAPASFLSIAERFGLVEQIDRWVVREAIRMLAEAQRAGTDLRLEVNLSAHSVCDPTLPGVIAEQLTAAAVDPRRLCFEVTETVAIVNVERAKQFAESLSKLGCEFALDDFGAGFASFYYLKHLSFDYLKIDGEFIRDLAGSRTNQLVVRSVVDIARGLGKRTIAEFVGDEPTVELLRAYGVDFAQGFHVGRPAPLDLDAPAPPPAPAPERPPGLRR